MFQPIPLRFRHPRDGYPLAGGHVYIMEAGPSGLPKAAYMDAAGDMLACNPTVLDAEGCADLYGDGEYRLHVTDDQGYALHDYTISVEAAWGPWEAASAPFMVSPGDEMRVFARDVLVDGTVDMTTARVEIRRKAKP